MKAFTIFLAIPVVVVGLAGLGRAAIIHIPDDYQTIQAGIDEAGEGDTVLVQPGAYEENLTIEASLVLASLTLTTGDPAYIDSTVIDGRQQGSVISADIGDDSELLIRGFTICNGLTSGNGGGVCCYNCGRIQLDDLLINGNVADDGFWQASGGGLSARVVSSISLNRVRIIGNKIQGNGGGGADFREVNAAELTDCILTGNQSNYMGGGIYDYHCSIKMTRVLIANNIGGWCAGGGLMHMEGGSLQLDHVTFADNSADNYAGAFYAKCTEGSFITNSIVYGNHDNSGGWVIYLDSQLDFTYCDIERGIYSIHGEPDVFESNIDQDPSFYEPLEDNYHLEDNSPCIDAGDPDAEVDSDGSCTDIGAFPYAPQISAFLGGQVLDSETGFPIAGASVLGHAGQHGFRIQAESDSLGVWGGRIRSYTFDAALQIQLEIAAEGYLQDSSEVDVASGDSVWIETGLDHGEFLSSPDSLAAEVDSGTSKQIPLTIRNGGNGRLRWQAVAQTLGDAGSAPWVLRQSIPVGEITRDDQIEGVIFDGESYYCAGVNGDDSNMVYSMNRRGELLALFPQPGHSHYGFTDLEWDGELIWGSGEDTVYAIHRDGEVAHRWRGPFNPNTNIACDPDEGMLWLSGTATNFSAYDRDGNYLDRTLERQGLFTYGLAWCPDDPDSANLYALNLPSGDSSAQINKFNPRTGEMRLVSTIPLNGATELRGAFICCNYDRYQSLVMMDIADIPPNLGGDQIQVWQVQPNSEWLTIDLGSGDMGAGEESQVNVNLSTAAEDGNWAFALGEYDGEVVFTHDGFGGETILPVHLTVVEPNDVSSRTVVQPSTIGIVSIYPNPFNLMTTITYDLPRASPVNIRVYDLTGRHIATLLDGYVKAGRRRVLWDASAAAAGVYLLRMETGESSTVQKAVLVK